MEKTHRKALDQVISSSSPALEARDSNSERALQAIWSFTIAASLISNNTPTTGLAINICDYGLDQWTKHPLLKARPPTFVFYMTDPSDICQIRKLDKHATSKACS